MSGTSCAIANVRAFAIALAVCFHAVARLPRLGTVEGGQRLAALGAFITDVHAVGLTGTQSRLLITAFYWDRTDDIRQWSKRFFARVFIQPRPISTVTF